MDVDQETKDRFRTQFIGVTGAKVALVDQFGDMHDWIIEPAVTAYFEEQAAGTLDAYDDDDDEEVEAGTSNTQGGGAADSTYTGPRTLGGAPAPGYQAPTKKKPAKKTGLATLSSLGGSSGHGHGHAHDDSDDDEEDDGRGDLYAGGEKSGLSVQDPKTGPGPAGTKKTIQEILAKARQNLPRDDDDEAEAGPSRSHFHGTGQTLGGEGSESRTIPAAGGSAASQPAASSNEPPQERTLHLWRNGFSIDDGELRSLDDPENARDLAIINRGQAPLHLMNIRYDQPVNVTVQEHNEPFRQLPRVYRPFGGEGRRLGSPTAEPSGGAGASLAEAVAPAAPAASSSSAAPTATVDESRPTLTIRIQMPDGTRLPARFNTTQTIGDVYDFVQRASPDTQSRQWVLATTFPNKDHNDKGFILGEMAEFKRGGTAVVKWAS